MILKAEVKCYHCGYVSGEWLSATESGARKAVFRPVADCTPRPQAPDSRLRCCRCGGPVYLEDVTVVREGKASEPALREREASI
jgi:hypothetical protein